MKFEFFWNLFPGNAVAYLASLYMVILSNLGLMVKVDENDWTGLFLKRAPDLITDGC